jgi:predicted amidohydrolase
VKVAVIQHMLRAHERMDLAALLSSAQEASDTGATVIVCPSVPGLSRNTRIYQAFIENMRMHAPGSLVLTPALAIYREGDLEPFLTPLGRTLALVGDECIDPGYYESIERVCANSMLWQPGPESALQAEAILELALDASLSLAGLVIVTSLTGRAHGAAGYGGAAIVHLGDILAEAVEGEDIVTAELTAPVTLPDRRGPRPTLPPILAQRLAHHRGGKLPVEWPADLS